jgi:ADP-ribosylglycohydrolase
VLGAVIGDIIGSVHEFNAPKTNDFPLFSERCYFTDDTVLSVAVADCLLSGASYVDKFHEYTKAYPHRAYGGGFLTWVESGSREPYNSWGNGSAMRVSPAGFAFDTLEETLAEAKRSAEVTHNHPEGIKGAQATAAAIFLARHRKTKKEIRDTIAKISGYDLDRTCHDIRPRYKFNESCQKTVPEAIVAFLDSSSYEDAVRLAVSLGGDADTLACITGGIAEAFYGGVPRKIREQGWSRLDDRLRGVIELFYEKYKLPRP